MTRNKGYIIQNIFKNPDKKKSTKFEMKSKSDLKRNYLDLNEDYHSKRNISNFEIQKNLNGFEQEIKLKPDLAITSISSLNESSKFPIKQKFTTFKYLENPESITSNEDFNTSNYQNKSRMSKLTFGNNTKQNSLNISKQEKDQENEDLNDSLLNQLNKLKLDSVENLNNSGRRNTKINNFNFPEDERETNKSEESNLLITHSSEKIDYFQKQQFFGEKEKPGIENINLDKKPHKIQKEHPRNSRPRPSRFNLKIGQTKTLYFIKKNNLKPENDEIAQLEGDKKDLSQWLKVILI
jgi:hypothetical protein